MFSDRPIDSQTLLLCGYCQFYAVQNAAEEISMSHSGFARKFKERLGVSFFDYLTRLRLRVARELLTTTNLPAAVIGEKTGLVVRKSV